MSLAFYRDAKTGSVEHLDPVYVEWNADPEGGGWTGYEIIEAQMRRGDIMASHPCVDPRTGWQYAGYHHLQNIAPVLGYERRPPAPHGLGFLHLHFERRSQDEEME